MGDQASEAHIRILPNSEQRRSRLLTWVRTHGSLSASAAEATRKVSQMAVRSWRSLGEFFARDLVLRCMPPALETKSRNDDATNSGIRLRLQLT